MPLSMSCSFLHSLCALQCRLLWLFVLALPNHTLFSTTLSFSYCPVFVSLPCLCLTALPLSYCPAFVLLCYLHGTLLLLSGCLVSCCWSLAPAACKAAKVAKGDSHVSSLQADYLSRSAYWIFTLRSLESKFDWLTDIASSFNDVLHSTFGCSSLMCVSHSSLRSHTHLIEALLWRKKYHCPSCNKNGIWGHQIHQLFVFDFVSFTSFITSLSPP